LKRVRWKLVDKFFPRDEVVPFAYARRRGGSCRRCGKCCVLLRTQADLEYFSEVARHWRRWARTNSKPIPPEGREAIRLSRFFLDNFVRVSRFEALRRGFVSQIEPNDFFYHCLAVRPDGSCSKYDNGRPVLCTGFPFYPDASFPEGTPKRLKKVFETCGFAGTRGAR
jgi:Fe-S-cluster containining protein